MAAREAARVRRWLNDLCLAYPSRSTGSPGNRAAADRCARHFEQHGWRVRQPAFACIDWHQHGAELTCGGSYTLYPGPYSNGCDLRAPLVVVSSLEALRAARAEGAVLLLTGALAREQLMPRNFTFYNPEEHQAIYAALDAARPAAVLAATGRNPELVGAQYPYPLIEDGDFDIPNAYMTDAEGARLAQHAGQEAHLVIRASRSPASGSNVIARLGDEHAPRILLTAHLDAHIGSPGATDDGSGVAALLLAGELLGGWRGVPGLEIALLNGEDYYAASGEMLWLAENASRMDDILLGINLDDVAYISGRTAWALYGCPEPLAAAIRSALAGRAWLMEGEPWYQGDHMLLVQHGRPALTFTSELMGELMATICHSAQDTPDKVDAGALVLLAHTLAELLERLATL